MRKRATNLGKERTAVFRVLRKILGPNYDAIGKFGLRWIRWADCHPSTMRQTHELLRSIGLTERQIVRNVTLLGLPEVTVRQSYKFLRSVGLSDKAIAADPQLLALNTRTLKRNYQGLSRIDLAAEVTKHPALLHRKPGTLKRNLKFLNEKGLRKEKILRNALLLASNPGTLERHWHYLRTRGLSDEKIATNAHLLQLSLDSIAQNYEKLRRFFEKDRIATFASLLGIPAETVLSNVQFLDFLGIDYARYPLACMSTPGTKRRKIASLMQHLFGSQNAEEAFPKVRQLVRENPKLLIYSVSTLERMQKKLNARVQAWPPEARWKPKSKMPA